MESDVISLKISFSFLVHGSNLSFNLPFCCIPGSHVKLKGAIDKPWSHG
jgi:hypothetical protein